LVTTPGKRKRKLTLGLPRRRQGAGTASTSPASGRKTRAKKAGKPSTPGRDPPPSSKQTQAKDKKGQQQPQRNQEHALPVTRQGVFHLDEKLDRIERMFGELTSRHRVRKQAWRFCAQFFNFEFEVDPQAAPPEQAAPKTVAVKPVLRAAPPPLIVALNSYADACLFFAPNRRDTAHNRATRWVDLQSSGFLEVDRDQALRDAIALLKSSTRFTIR